MCEDGAVRSGRLRLQIHTTGVLLAAVITLGLVAPSASVAARNKAATFTATGSAEQVYVTGLGPFARRRC